MSIKRDFSLPETFVTTSRGSERKGFQKTDYPLIDRVLYKCKKKKGHLLWQGCVNDKGYGQIRFEGKVYYVHRVMWEYVNGRIVGVLHHVCEFTICCNTDHMEEFDSHSDHMRNRHGAM